jgi:hypothetical protein
MSSEVKALAALLIPLIIGVWLSVPDEVDVAKTVVETVQKDAEPDSLAQKTAQMVFFTLGFLGVALFIAAIVVPTLKLVGF